MAKRVEEPPSPLIRIQYALWDGARLAVCVDRDVKAMLWAQLQPKGVGAFKTEAAVKAALDAAVDEVFALLPKA